MITRGMIKVQSAVMMKPEYVKQRNPNGSFIPSQEMLDLLNDQTPAFREPIITFINDLVTTEWGVYFTPFTDEKFDVRVYCETSDDYFNIVSVIKERLTDKKFEGFFHEGTRSDLDKQWN